MNKPISMIIDDFKNKIAADINEYTDSLPLFLLDLTLRDLLSEVHQLSQAQAASEKQLYEKSLEQEDTTDTLLTKE